jgi:MoaA/NifB/PqqE/SkfB family radical SAM enzyme
MKVKTVEEILNKFPDERIDWFDWGEPLLHKDFLTIAEMVKGTQSNISTNFSLEVPDEYFKAMQNFNIIYVSISGMTPKVYNLYNNGGNFNLVMSNLEKLIQQKKTKIFIQYLYHPENKQHYELARYRFLGLGADEVNKVKLNCEIEERIEGFTHPYLRTNYGAKAERFKCVPYHRVTIGVHGEHFLCCMTHNVPIGATIDDEISRHDIKHLKLQTPICIECREKEYWRQFS